MRRLRSGARSVISRRPSSFSAFPFLHTPQTTLSSYAKRDRIRRDQKSRREAATTTTTYDRRHQSQYLSASVSHLQRIFILKTTPMSIYFTAADEYKHISFVIIILCDLTVSTYPTDIIGKFRSLVEDHSRLSLID